METTILKKEQLTSDVYSFYFKKPNDFDFKPGQYITFHFGDKDDDYDDWTHDFTIASSPLDDFIMITTHTISHSKFKTRLLELKENDSIRYTGPAGGFYFKEDIQDYVFLAGGIGITPYHSMLRYIDSKKLNTNVVLFASFSTRDEMVFYDELKEIEQKNPSIKIIYTLTKEEWDGETGRISPDMIKKYVNDITLPRFLITGPPTMVTALEEMIDNAGVPLEHIQTEQFTGY